MQHSLRLTWLGLEQETIKTQEKVIGKLEHIIETRMGHPRAKHMRRWSAQDGGANKLAPVRPPSSRRSSAADATSARTEAEEGEDEVGDEEPVEGEIEPKLGNGKEMECTIKAWNLAMVRLKVRQTRVGVRWPRAVFTRSSESLTVAVAVAVLGKCRCWKSN